MADINFGGVTIPSQQTLSPAGHDDIAFRPSCDQLVPIQREDTVFWTITLSDGQQRVLQHFPPLSQQEAYYELDAYGICKIGGVDVPLVYTAQVPQRQVATVTTTPELGTAEQGVSTITPQTANSGSLPLWAMGAGGLLLLLVIGFLFKATQGDNRKATQSQQPKPKQGQDINSELDNIFGGRNDA